MLTGWEMTPVDGSLQPVWTVPEPPIAGWHEGSALPGQAGNTVISGHNWPQDGVFRDLYRVQPGTRITVCTQSAAFVYIVSQVLLLPEEGQPLAVRQANGAYAQPTDDERLTLVTCHPYGSLANRLIVIARPAGALSPAAAR